MEYGDHPRVRGHAEDITKIVVTDVVAGRGMVFNENFITEIQSVRLPSLVVVEEPILRIIRDLTWKDLAIDRVSMIIPTWITIHRVSWVMCCVMCFCECCISGRSTGQVPVSCCFVLMWMALFDRFQWTQKLPPPPGTRLRITW